ncbi:C6 zinc finger domain protein [Exophiala viscosa]|uniref:C6 zinc finger domain protein n=1 Tax=Exophiala viscosa TaxID=2486360 RepID=UPI00219D60C8|nr:C6 zinc finger domain protein [Exophiala viscosa]
MPRPRKSTSAPVNRRTRSGCLTCRKRKIKCGEQAPTCDQCNAKGLECVTTAPLKWETEYLSRGLRFGRAGVWSKDPLKAASPSSPAPAGEVTLWCTVPKIFSYSFVNTTVGTIQDLKTLDFDSHPDEWVAKPDRACSEAQTAEEVDTKSTLSLSPWLTTRQLARSQASILPPLAVSAHLSMNLGKNDTTLLLSYYVENVCPVTTASSSSISPFASLFIPFAITASPLAMDSILALAACHRSRSDGNYKPTALQLSHGVLKTLRARLRDLTPDDVALDVETLVVMLLLCMFEIVNECDKRWVVHLKGARDLIRVRRQIAPRLLPSSDVSQLVHFCERFFAFQDVIGRTACGEDPVFGTDFWEDNPDCDAWLGCSPELVAILSEITELGRQDRASRATSPFQAATAGLEYRLDNLAQNVWDMDDDILAQSAELKRLSAELYLQCLLNGADPSISWVSDQVNKILRAVAALLDRGVAAGISWPLFVAAVELDADHDFQDASYSGAAPWYARPFVLYALNQLANSMVNITRTRSVIEKVWQARDLTRSVNSEPDLDKNDWEQLIAPLCGNMSLA